MWQIGERLCTFRDSGRGRRWGRGQPEQEDEEEKGEEKGEEKRRLERGVCAMCVMRVMREQWPAFLGIP